MKWLILVCFLVSFNVYASEAKCPPEETEAITQLEQEINNCTVDYGDNEWRTAEMLKAYANAENCLKNVAYKIFDKYFVKYNNSIKENFDNYVNAVTSINYDIMQRSDWAGNIRMAEVFVLQAEGGVHFMIRSIVKEYLQEIRDECGDAYNFARDFAHEFDN